MFKMERKNKKYTKEFKQASVTLALKSPSISRTATELGIPVATLHTSTNQLLLICIQGQSLVYPTYHDA